MWHSLDFSLIFLFKAALFAWKEGQQRAFDLLKQKLIGLPILAYADYRLPFKLHTDASCTGLGAVLYRRQNNEDRVVAYASRNLKPSEKNYPAHKLEFLALKWTVTKKFHDYLYGTQFNVVTDNNPLTYVFTTAKLDATGQRWLAELSNYNCTISYRSGKQNADADGLSRMHDTNTESTIFPEVLKALVQAHSVQQEGMPYVGVLNCEEDSSQSDIDPSGIVPDDTPHSTALTKHDWRKAPAADKNLEFLITCLIEGRQPSTEEADKN